MITFSEAYLFFVTGLLIGISCGIVWVMSIGNYNIQSGVIGLLIGFSFGYWIKWLDKER